MGKLLRHRRLLRRRAAYGSYVALTAAALLLPAHLHRALFVVAAAALGLLLIGIHNAWDTVIHIVVSQPQHGRK